MKNAPCTPLTPEEEAAIMSAFPASLTPEEDADAAKLFKPYVFYASRPDKSRDCYCSVCGGRFNVSRKGHADFFKASHRGKGDVFHQERMKANCPECGVKAEVVAVGKFKNFASLCEHRPVTRLSACDGWLLAQAGVVIREFALDGSGAVTQSRRFHEFRRFAFKPGRRNEWQLKAKFYSYGYGRDVYANVSAGDFYGAGYRNLGPKAFAWVQRKSVGEAHFPAPYHMTAYGILNPGAIAETEMRYCQFFAWHDFEYGKATDGGKARYYANLCVYLSEYTRRPQFEMLWKLGCGTVISDLIIRGNAFGDSLNWKADNPREFFGMSDADFRVFRDCGMDIPRLTNYRNLRKAGLVRDMREYAGFRKKFTGSFDDFCKACFTVGLTVRRGANYLTAYMSRTETSLDVSVTLWMDYLDAAVKLGYDFTRDDVRMPKNLAERHDAATQAVQTEADERERKRYRPIFDALRRRYEYGADGLLVVVPTCVADIVTEGKILQTCVGGYAARHMEGKTVILFLRRESNLSAPYVTLELTADNNPAKVELKQIHGYRNDIGATESPRQRHKSFLDNWLAWVHEGSPRDDDGTPVTLSGDEG